MAYNTPYLWVPPASSVGGMDPDEIAIARERGRLGAVGILLESPEKRAEIERVYGLPYCKARYPEVYENSRKPFLDRLKFW